MAFEKLSNGDIPQLTGIVFHLSTILNQLWSLFVASSGLVVGWLFSTNPDWDVGKTCIAIALYVLFAVVNFCMLRSIYSWLDDALASLRSAAHNLEGNEQEPGVKKALVNARIPGGRLLGYGAYIVTVALVGFSIGWFT